MGLILEFPVATLVQNGNMGQVRGTAGPLLDRPLALGDFVPFP